jgi:hypothetical protein
MEAKMTWKALLNRRKLDWERDGRSCGRQFLSGFVEALLETGRRRIVHHERGQPAQALRVFDFTRDEEAGS